MPSGAQFVQQPLGSPSTIRQKRYWEDPQTHKIFFDQLGEKLGVQSMADWYRISRGTVVDHGGGHIMKTYYSNSFVNALRSIYPNHEWKVWKFDAKLPQRFWASMENQVAYFKDLENELGIASIDGWYTVSPGALEKYGAAGFINNHYKGKLFAALQAIYPHHKWRPWRFDGPPRGYWKTVEARKEFFDALADHLGYQSMEDWYSVRYADLKEFGGAGLMASYYRDSVYQALRDVYPTHTWVASRFSWAPRGMGLFSVPSNISLKEADLKLQELAAALGLTSPEDWRNVSAHDLHAASSLQLVDLVKLLTVVYPTKKWDVADFRSQKKHASQGGLASVVRSIFPNETIIEDYAFFPDKSQEADAIAFDLFIPSLRLAFGFQSTITSVRGHKGGFDAHRVAEAKRNGVSLVVVPASWTNSRSALEKLIRSNS